MISLILQSRSQKREEVTQLAPDTHLLSVRAQTTSQSCLIQDAALGAREVTQWV